MRKMVKMGRMILYMDLNMVVYQGKKCREVYPRQTELCIKPQRLSKYNLFVNEQNSYSTEIKCAG